jgi:hypothetical protein
MFDLNFKCWLLIETVSDEYLKGLFPKSLLGSGTFAMVYSTQDPDIVMRVEADMVRKNIKPEFVGQPCEKFMAKPEIQETGGVAKIYKIERRPYDFQDENKPLIITYKERVDPNWVDKWYDKYGDKVWELLSAFSSHDKNRILKKLAEFDNTEGLIRAVELGLPLRDLPKENLGLNKDGQLVVIDC